MLPVAVSSGDSFRSHWKPSGGVPVAVTRIVTLAPKLTDWLRGYKVIVGGVVYPNANSADRQEKNRSNLVTN